MTTFDISSARLLADLLEGVPEAFVHAERVKRDALAGVPEAREAWRSLVTFDRARRQEDPRQRIGGNWLQSKIPPPSFSGQATSQLLDLYERLCQNDATAWNQLSRVIELGRMGDRNSERFVKELSVIHRERSAGNYGGPTFTGYSMPVSNRAGFAPYVVVGGRSIVGAATFDPFAMLFPNGMPPMPPGLPPLPMGIPMQVPQLPKEMILPLTEQVFEMLLQLIRQAKAGGGGLDREKATVVPMDDGGLMRAAPQTSTIQKAFAIDPVKQRMTQVAQPIHAPTYNILQYLNKA